MYKCNRCGSTDVEEKMWVNINTMKLSDNPYANSDLDSTEDHFCNNCETNVILILEKDV